MCQDVADTFKKFFSTLGDGSDKPKKTVLMMCLLIPITNTAHIAVFLCHCWFLFNIYDGAVDLTRSQCTVSDTQVTGKTHGPLVSFPYLTSRIHQEYITAFQDKLNFREITGRERMYKNFMTWKFNMKIRYEKKVCYLLYVVTVYKKSI